MADDKVIPLEKWNDRWKREGIITRRQRVRREREPPRTRSTEAGADRAPYRTAFPHLDLELAYRRGRWFDINEESGECLDEGYDDRLRVRQTSAWLLRDGAEIGTISLAEYDPPLFFDDGFCYWMDAFEQHMGCLAEVCCTAWPDFTHDVASYGKIVELDTVWMKPGSAEPGIWREPLDFLLRRLCHRASIVIAHAFPLEYSGRAGSEHASRRGFELRRAAMVKWAQGHMGLRPLPGRSGEEGWLWRPARRRVAPHIPEPIWNPDWRRDRD